MALAEGDEIRSGDLPAAVLGVPPPAASVISGNFKDAKEQVVGAFERQFFTAALEHHRGNVTRAAEEMGMYRQHLQVKLGKLGIDPGDYR